MGRKRRSRIGWAGVFVGLPVAAVVLLFATDALIPRSDSGSGGMLEDENNLRQLVSLTLTPSGIPVRDGAFDPYAFARRGDISLENFPLFRSKRSRSGPTDEEIERDDYTNFPWDRYRGDGGTTSATFPLLWEKMPDRHGGRLVAFSDGSARYCEAPTFAISRIVGLVAQLGRLPMNSGAFDPYAFVREGHLPADLLRPGPTDEDIARGDYSRFPWERYRGDGRLEGPPFALLWKKAPDAYGRFLVGRSDGTVRSR